MAKGRLQDMNRATMIKRVRGVGVSEPMRGYRFIYPGPLGGSFNDPVNLRLVKSPALLGSEYMGVTLAFI
jgi:hypothetical protein